MKTLINSKELCVLALLASLPLLGCSKSGSKTEGAIPAPLPPPTASSVTPAEKTSFQEVSTQLDAGGDFYMYLSTEDMLQGISSKVSSLRNLLGSLPNAGQRQEQLGQAVDLVSHLIKDSGIEEVSGVGLSSIPAEGALLHNKLLLHHYSGKGDGFLWSMLGKKAHDLDGLDLLPAKTVFAAWTDLDFPMLWSVIEKEAAQSGIPGAEQAFSQMRRQFQMGAGLDWDKALASLGNEYGIVVTLDEEKTVSLPVGDSPLQVPEPALMFVVKVKDDTIFNRIDAALKSSGLPGVVSTDKSDLKMRTLQGPVPVLRPTFARSGDYLFIASSDTLVQEAVGVKAGQKKGLKSTAEFQRLSKGVPQQGNQFVFVSERLERSVRELVKMASANLPAQQSLLATTLQSLLLSDKPGCLYAVGGNNQEGWLGVANGTQHPIKLVAAGVVVPLGIAMFTGIRARTTRF